MFFCCLFLCSFVCFFVCERERVRGRESVESDYIADRFLAMLQGSILVLSGQNQNSIAVVRHVYILVGVVFTYSALTSLLP